MSAYRLAARLAVASGLCLALGGCLAVQATGAVIGVAGAAAEATVKTTGAVAGALIPFDDGADRRGQP